MVHTENTAGVKTRKKTNYRTKYLFISKNLKMLKNMCRVCGRYAAYKRSIRIFDNPNILWKLQVLTGIILENVECLPDLICICCQTELREAIRFRDRVFGAQHELLAGLTEEQLEQIPAEYKEAILEFSQRETNNDDSDDDSVSKIIDMQGEQVDVITEADHKEEETFEENEHLKQDDLMEYNIVIDDELVKEEIAAASTVEDDQHVEIIEEEQPFTIVVQEEGRDQENVNYILPDRESDEDCAMLDRVLSDEIADTQHVNAVKKKPGRKRVGSLIFICDECGNHITGRMAFDLHCRRHRGDKQFECDICRDRFCTNSELKRHMRRHTGERPFACQYCERCFTDYSTRVKHERTHTNERPYGCQSCGKAFTTAYILKNHMLIHSGERAFSCELCNKTFIRQTHLVTHYRSSAHKRNMERQQQEFKS
ncbi:transcription factor Ouib-like [Drosophila nasuta]|uniref:transcription factor Ouib-like n=1 Tax=Drosophila nasuta TaxID=42062 RepID=UPI00295EC86F|nr:transcription factor Ouib-like [Drosophila nasuta]